MSATSRTYPFARYMEGVDPATADRTATRASGDWDVEVRVFPSRAFMARMLRQQQRGPSHGRQWRAVVALAATEGY